VTYYGLPKPIIVSMEENSMLDFIIEEIINFIKGDFGKKIDSESHLLYWIKQAFNQETKYNTPESFYFNKELFDTKVKDFSNFFKEIKDIKHVYQKGMSFVHNNTRGKKKGFNFRYHQFLKIKIERGEIEEAQKDAIEHLNRIKKYNSERTYYRHKKRIRDLGIEI